MTAVGARTTALALLAAAASGASGCQVVNDIDVCDRGGGVERQTNGRTDGDQIVTSSRSLVALATGESLVTFTSTDGGGVLSPSEIRGAVMNGAGVSLGTCSEQTEKTWAPLDPAAPPKARRFPTLGRPVGTDSYTLLVYGEGPADVMPEDEAFQVFGQVLDTSGCPVGVPVQISDEPAGLSVTWMQAVPTAAREHLVFWMVRDQAGAPQAIRARAVELQIIPQQPIAFLPTADSRDGDVVEVPETKGLNLAFAAAERGDGGALLAWIALGGLRQVHLASFDAVLAPAAHTVVASIDGSSSPVDRSGVDVASDGAQALIAWAERDKPGTGGRARVFGRFYTPKELLGLRAPQAPDGGAFRLGSSVEAIDEGYPNLAVAPEGGFAATWNEAGDPSRPDASGASVRGLLIGSDGGPEFANLACDRRDFQLNVGGRSDQLVPNAAFGADGSLLAIWTDRGQNGTDRSTDAFRAGVRTIAIAPRLLRPLP
jgi:hypothetical protein